MDFHTLPFADPSVDALPSFERAALVEHWRHRASSERKVGRAFNAMIPRLRSRDAAPEVLRLLASSAEEEERHAYLCLLLAERYAGSAMELPPVGDVPLPDFGFADADLECALLVSGMCCVNETIATAWLGACTAASTTPLALAANRIHLADEIGHARLGWAHLASAAVSTEIRAALGELLPPLFEANVSHWLEPRGFIASSGIPGHGQPDAATTATAVIDALRDVVLPGFAHVGVDIREATAWLDAHPIHEGVGGSPVRAAAEPKRKSQP